MTQPKFEIGDPVPAITLLARSGEVVNLAHQEYAGTALALWCTPGDVAEPSVREAEKIAQQFSRFGARLIHLIVGAQPSHVPALSQDSGLMQLFDPRNEVAHLFGVDRVGIIQFDRNRRFQGAMTDRGPKDALTLYRARYAQEPVGTITQQAPVLLVPNIFDEAQRAALIDYWEHGPKEQGNNLATVNLGNNYDGPKNKRRTDVAIQSKTLFETVMTRVERRVCPEIFKAFQFVVDRLEMPRIGCYDSANLGEFRRHRDNTTPFTAHRKFALSINLNDGYEGGAVAFPEYGRTAYVPPAGGGVVFSCSLLHEAQPVTRGRRFGLFTFFTDAEGGRREDEMIAKQGSNIKRYALE